MHRLYTLLENYTIDDVLKLEKEDLQYKALEILYKEIINKKYFLPLIIANSIICYQLSSSWEKYWQELSTYFSNLLLNNKEFIDFDLELLINNLWDFILKSKWNKRFTKIKISRLQKLKEFLIMFYKNEDYYSTNLIIFRDTLALTMKQRKDAKTIVFAVKMFLYWLSIINTWKEIICPFEISIPIDSRLINIFEKYCEEYSDIKLFYFDLSKKLNIPEIHLDSLIWINYEKIYNLKI